MTSATSRFAHDMHDAFAPITEVLYECFAEALLYEENNRPKLSNAGEMQALRSHLIRLATRSALADRDLGEWRLAGNPNQNGQLKLACPKRGIELRVLKAGPKGKSVPHAGHNGVRRAYWTNTPLPLFEQLSLLPGIESHNLVLTWEQVGVNEVNLQVVRPISEGTYFGRVQVDFVMDLAPQRSDFENLVFQGEDVEEDLFSPMIENENGTTEDGFGF